MSQAPAGRVIADREQDRLADDVMDMIQAADSANTHHVTAEQAEHEKRLEVAFLNGFRLAVNDQLQPAGIRCEGVLPDGEGRGYRVFCRDTSGRPLNADLTFDESLELFARFEGDGGPKLVALICDRIVEARKTWFRRMGLT